jgi:hypothetical protein
LAGPGGGTTAGPSGSLGGLGEIQLVFRRGKRERKTESKERYREDRGRSNWCLRRRKNERKTESKGGALLAQKGAGKELQGQTQARPGRGAEGQRKFRLV